MRCGLEYYERCEITHPDHSYEWLLKRAKFHINRKRQLANREATCQSFSGKSYASPASVAPAAEAKKGKGGWKPRGNSPGSGSNRGSSPKGKRKGVCYRFRDTRSVTPRIVPTCMSALSRQVASAAVAEAVRAVQVGVGVSVRVARPMPNLSVGFGPRMAGATKVTNASFPMNALGLRLQCLLRPSPQVRRNRQRKPVGGRPAVHHPGEQTVPREAEAQSRDLLPLSLLTATRVTSVMLLL